MMKKGVSPLAGLKVLDLSQIMAGPYCTMVLADLGAEVIKVEKAGKGDDSREMGPFVNGESASFAHINRNKKGVVVNLKDPEGREIVYDQKYRYNLAVKRTLEQIVRHYPGDRDTADFRALTLYLKRVWFANGIHHHYAHDKLAPGFAPSAFRY